MFRVWQQEVIAEQIQCRMWRVFDVVPTPVVWIFWTRAWQFHSLQNHRQEYRTGNQMLHVKCAHSPDGNNQDCCRWKRSRVPTAERPLPLTHCLRKDRLKG